MSVEAFIFTSIFYFNLILSTIYFYFGFNQVSFFNKLKQNTGNAKTINHNIVNITPCKTIGCCKGHPFKVKFPIVSDAIDKCRKRLKPLIIGCALSIGQIRPRIL